MSIKLRLTLVTLATILLSLVITAGGLFTFEYYSHRDRLRSDLHKSAEIVAKNSSAAVMFSDVESAVDNLAAFESDDRIEYGAITLATGELLAEYGTAPTEGVSADELSSTLAPQIRGGIAFTVHPIILDDEVIGFVSVVANMSEWRARVQQMTLVISGLALISMALAWLASRKWQAGISDPLQALTSEVRAIQSEREYGRQVEIEADGEVGDLITGFNSMLQTIQDRQNELTGANELLDRRVKERTSELELEVSERTRAEQELLRNQKIVNDFLQNAPLGIAWVRADGSISRSNQVLQEIFECDRSTLDGAPIDSFFENPETVKELFGRLKRDETVSALEARIRSPHGSIKHVQISANVLWDHGQFIFARMFLLDTTELKTAEADAEARGKFERANRAKNEFLSRMSHELRTPMNAILGFSQLLEFDDLTAVQRENVGHILTAGRHLLSLIEEVLSISRIESGKLSLSLEAISLEAIVDEVCGLLNPLAKQHNVSVIKETSGLGDVAVHADRQRLIQVLVNVLSNAIKYNKRDGEVTIAYELEEGERVRLLVRDTGIGFPQKELDRLFIPFERLGAESTGIEGTGLGLALSKALVAAMGGDLELVESEPGVGSTFGIVLPVSSTKPIVRGESESRQSVDHSRDGVVCVLSIEDNELNVKLIEQYFKKRRGFVLHTAISGRDGLTMFAKTQPDLVLLDLHLPDMMGQEVLQRIRSTDRGSTVPIIVISADVNEETVVQMNALGADAFCSKPIDLGELGAVIDDCLARKDEAA